jgi:KaiC/GvpD/RAD55 family RecA-like ATPase
MSVTTSEIEDSPPPWEVPVQAYAEDAALAGEGMAAKTTAPLSFEAMPGFSVRRLDELETGAPVEIVQRFYGLGHVIALVGPPNSGKTALAVDHALAVSANTAWFGLKVSGGTVVYIAPEAPASVIMRAWAAMALKFPDQKLPFYIAQGTPALGGEVTSLVDSERVIATIRQVESREGAKVKLVLIDTLASCLGDGDENGVGMIRLVAAAKFIAAAVGCAVMLIHHPSKGDGAGLRGHGSLAAACDAILTVAVDVVSGVRTATLIKSRDSATGLQLCYSLEPVTLSTPDSFGDPRTTIIVRPVTVQNARPVPKGKQQQALLADLERRHRTGETGWTEAVIREAGRMLGIKPQSSRDALKGLISAGYVWGTPMRHTLKYPPQTESTK